ncbi:MAG: DUF4062 domain-containing protein [Candidatus Brocadiaceae bacterium]|nr:DUF4062 domain-containing protein [Candidatus Brocadiaceae bacterium]
MDKRYQVFVSSTYQDLQEERQEVMHALLELDCIPSGMELFPAANESQWTLIKKVIDDCDYYLLILGGRYGSISPDGLSYTEMEYRYALSNNKPIIAFLHKDPGLITAKKSEDSPEGKQKLLAFREFTQLKLCKFWTTPAELGSVVSRSLVQLIKTTPAVGWVRGDELPDRDATLELLRLRKRTDELEAELQRARTTAPKGTEDLAQGDELHTIRYSFTARDPTTYQSVNWTGKFQVTWNDIFAAIGPLMINEASEPTLRKAFNDYVISQNQATLRKHKGLEDSTFSLFAIDESDFQTIKIQLRALGIIARSEKARSVKDVQTYWTITPYGDELMTRLRAIKRTVVPDEPPTVSKATKKA